MAINKKLIHFNQYSNFITKKLSANVDNTQYTIGIDSTVYDVDDDNKPDILYHSIVFIKDANKIWTHGQIYNCGGGITIVDSVDELNPDDPQGSLTNVIVDTIVDVNFSKLYQPTPDEVKITGTGVIVDTTNLSRVNGISINSSYDTTAEIPNFTIYLFSKDVDMQGGVGQMIGLTAGMVVTMNLATQEPQVLELFIPNEDGTITVNEENLAIINNLLSSTEFVYCGVRDEGSGEFLYHHPYIDMFYKTTSNIQKTYLYIKDYSGWRNVNEVAITDSVNKLDKNSPQGSLSVVAENYTLEKVCSVVDVYATNGRADYNINSVGIKNLNIEGNVDIVLAPQGIAGNIVSAPFINIYGDTFNCNILMASESEVDNEMLLIQEGEVQTDVLDELNATISSLGGVVLYGSYFSYVDLFITFIDSTAEELSIIDGLFIFNSIKSVDETTLYIKESNGWEKLKTGGSVETVDNLEDTSTDKALSANMGRVLNERISAVASGSVTSVAGTLNIKDLNAVKAAQELLSNNQQVTYIITDSNGNYPSPNNLTVYIDTEDHILDILYRGNGDALKWLLKNKQAYYNYNGSWYSQTISGDLVKLPSLHLRTAQVGDLITLIRQDISAEEFYSKFVDYNNINLNLGTTEKLAFDAYLTFAGVKGALESISDGEAIRRLVEGGYIYSSEGDPNNGYTPNKLVSDGGLVTLYTAQITPNVQHLYNGEFWTGNMTGSGIYSYINNPDPAIPDREEGEVYTGYVSPDGTQTLVSMKNPFKAYKKVNNAWEKLETDTNYKTRYGWGTSLDSMLKTGVCAYTPATVAGMDANWTIFVTCSSDGDPTYYHLMQTAICRNDDMLGRIFQRMGWYKGNGEDLHFTDWKEVGGGSSGGSGDIFHCAIYINNNTVLEVNPKLDNTTAIGYTVLGRPSGDAFELLEIVPSVFVEGTIFANSSDTNYTVIILDEELNTEVQAVPRYSSRFLTTESVEQGEAVTEYTLMTRDIAQELGNDETKVMSQKAVTDAINNAITNALNTEV